MKVKKSKIPFFIPLPTFVFGKTGIIFLIFRFAFFIDWKNKKESDKFAFWDLPFSDDATRKHNQEIFVIIKGTIKNAQEIPEL